MLRKCWKFLFPNIFLFSVSIYILLAWLVSQDSYHAAFDAIHGYRIFDIDDSYRRYLAATPFSNKGIWFWNFYLPFNLLFDGFFSWLSNHSTFWMRVPHLLANLGGLWLVYRAGRRLEISGGWLLLACGTLLCMPLYALVSMSFYGESLLAAVMGVMIYALAAGKSRLCLSCAAIMPFIRPEGIFYLGFLVLERLWRKQFWQVAVMVVPSLFYFCVLMFVFDFSWLEYWQDRSAYGAIYSAVGQRADLVKEPWLPYFTINPLWWMLGLVGGLLPAMRQFLPLFAGGLVLMIYWFMQMVTGHANGEARYFFSLLPLFALSQAALLHATVGFVRHRWERLASLIAFSLMLFIGLENLLQLDGLRHVWTDGNRYPFGQTESRIKAFTVLPAGYSRALREVYAFTCAYTAYDPSVDKVLINSFQWFDKSDVCDLPSTVSVELSPQSPEDVYRYLSGFFLGMYPALPHYSFYRFLPAPNARVLDGNHHALYVTMRDQVFPWQSIAPLFTNQVFNVYKVSYVAEQHPPFFPAP